MKSIHFLISILIILLSSCKPETPVSDQVVDFGIYETVDSLILSNSVRDRLTELHVRFSENLQDPVLGYTLRNDRSWRDSLSAVTIREDVRIAVTAGPLDEEQGSFAAIVALKSPAFIDLSDIKETVDGGDHVEILFNFQGAKKWAEMTERNINRQLAFLLDDQIYNLPMVAAPIRSGMAMIKGLDTAEAGRIAGMLNCKD